MQTLRLEWLHLPFLLNYLCKWKHLLLYYLLCAQFLIIIIARSHRCNLAFVSTFSIVAVVGDNAPRVGGFIQLLDGLTNVHEAVLRQNITFYQYCVWQGGNYSVPAYLLAKEAVSGHIMAICAFILVATVFYCAMQKLLNLFIHIGFSAW